jgi:hypothetical protein
MRVFQGDPTPIKKALAGLTAVSVVYGCEEVRQTLLMRIDS